MWFGVCVGAGSNPENSEHIGKLTHWIVDQMSIFMTDTQTRVRAPRSTYKSFINQSIAHSCYRSSWCFMVSVIYKALLWNEIWARGALNRKDAVPLWPSSRIVEGLAGGSKLRVYQNGWGSSAPLSPKQFFLQSDLQIYTFFRRPK